MWLRHARECIIFSCILISDSMVSRAIWKKHTLVKDFKLIVFEKLTCACFFSKLHSKPYYLYYPGFQSLHKVSQLGILYNKLKTFKNLKTSGTLLPILTTSPIKLLFFNTNIGTYQICKKVCNICCFWWFQCNWHSTMKVHGLVKKQACQTEASGEDVWKTERK